MKLRGVRVPASFFGMVLGLVGLGSDWRLAARLWALPAWIGEAVMGVAVTVWLVLVLLHAAKWIWHRSAARAELCHPVQGCFVALGFVSTMLVALAVQPYARGLAQALFFVGAIGALAFTAWRHGGLWRGGRDAAATTPVVYLSFVAGGFVTAIVAGALGWADWGQLFFGAAVFGWLALESVILQRLFTGAALPAALQPTLGIQLAPPAVGLVAYLAVTEGAPGLAAQMLLGYALVQALILLRLLPWLREPGFGAGWWAVTFGVAALALGAERMLERGAQGPVEFLAPLLFVAANLVIGGIAIGSLVLLARGRLLPSQAP